ncbi:MAG TPA: hypothetical protein VLQ80_28995, partial [Candidatus Saccharimonadia bacterium]|nr:hypothetical protein [Candidatus Saccharimonadia bacterium]
ALFGLDNAPRTPNALQQRVNEIKALIFEARVYATRVQSLITTLGRALGHLSKLVSLVGIVTGNHSANQVIIQQLSLANQTLVTSTASQMAAQRADTLQQMSRELVIESLNRMEADSWASWPGVGGR